MSASDNPFNAHGSRSRVRRTAKWSAAVVATFTVIVATAFAALQTDFGRRQVANLLADALSRPGAEIAIDGLEGTLPHSLRFSGITIADARGPWAQIDALDVDWTPSALFHGAVHATAIIVKDAVVLRRPEIPPAPKPERVDFTIPSIILEKLRVETLRLEPAILGVPVILAADGSLSTPHKGAFSGVLSVRGVDGPAGMANLRAVFVSHTRTLDLSLDVDEPAGGLIARLADIEGLPALKVTLSGDGTIDDWNGRLDGRMDGLGTLAGDIALDFAGPMRGTAEMQLTLSKPVADANPLLGSKISVSVDAGYDPDRQHLDLRTTRFKNATGEIAGSASIALDTLAIDGRLDVRVDPSGPLMPMLAPVKMDALSASAKLSGTVTQPIVHISAAAARIDVPEATADAIRLEVRLTLQNASPMRVAAIGALQISSLATELVGVQAMLGPSPRLTFDAMLTPESGIAEFREAILEAQTFSMSGNGSFAMAGPNANFSFVAKIGNLKPLSAVAGIPLSGSADINGSVDVAAGRAHAMVKAEANRLTFGQPAIEELIGAAPVLSAEIARSTGGNLQVSSVRIDGRHLGVEGAVRWSADMARIDGNYQIKIPDLVPVGRLVGTSLSGSVSVEGAVAGTPAAPNVSGIAIMQNLGVAGTAPWREVRLNFDTRNLTGLPAVVLSVTAEGPLGKLDASASVERQRQGDWSVNKIRLTGLGGTAIGELVVPETAGPVRGALSGEFNSLSAVAAALDLPLEGRAKLNLSFQPRDGGQAAEGRITATKLALGKERANQVRIETFRLDLSGDGLLQAPQFKLTATAAGIDFPQGRLTHAAVSATGDLKGAKIGLSAAGDVLGPTDVTASGLLQRATDGGSLTLAKFAGKIAGQPIELLKPLHATKHETEYEMNGLELALAEGRISGRVLSRPSHLEASLAARAVPLRLLGLGEVNLEIDGTVDGTAELSGTPSGPNGRFDVHANDVLFKINGEKRAQLTGRVTGTLSGDRLHADAKIGGPDGISAKADAELPVILSLAPFDFSVPQDREISANVRLTGEVASAWALLPLPTHQLTGIAAAELTIRGKLDAPEINGFASLTRGSYENLSTGTVFRSINVRIVGDRSRLEIAEASASDGAEGRLSASGTVNLAAANQNVDVRLVVDNAQLVRRDDITAVASGKLALTGSPDKLKLSGTITANGIEVRLIDTLPPDVVVFKIDEEVGQDASPLKPTREKAPSDIELDLVLDAPKRVFVRGRGLESEWGGKLTVIGTADAPAVNGSIQVLRGRFTFLGKKFTLDKGTVILEGGSEPRPVLDVTAKYQRSDFEATIRVRGPANQPKFALSSSPDLPRDEIVARILFNRGTNQLSPIEAVQLANAVATLTGNGAGGGVMETIRNALGVDFLSAGVSEEGKGAEVSAGRYIADGVYVGAKQGTQTGSGAATVEVEITPNISVESEVGRSGRSNVGVQWKFDY